VAPFPYLKWAAFQGKGFLMKGGDMIPPCSPPSSKGDLDEFRAKFMLNLPSLVPNIIFDLAVVRVITILIVIPPPDHLRKRIMQIHFHIFPSRIPVIPLSICATLLSISEFLGSGSGRYLLDVTMYMMPLVN